MAKTKAGPAEEAEAEAAAAGTTAAAAPAEKAAGKPAVEETATVAGETAGERNPAAGAEGEPAAEEAVGEPDVTVEEAEPEQAGEAASADPDGGPDVTVEDVEPERAGEAASADEDESRGAGGAKRPARRKAVPSGPERADGPLRATATVLLVVAAVWAAWAGWSWYAAAHDDSLHYSRLRDQVLSSGEQAIQNLNTLDYRDLDRGLKTWQDSSTSELYQQIVQGRQQFEEDVREAKTVTTAKILEGAVTELDDHAGKASVIVAVQITVALPDQRPAVKQTRLIGQLTRTASGWKLSALGQAPAGTSGS